MNQLKYIFFLVLMNFNIQCSNLTLDELGKIHKTDKSSGNGIYPAKDGHFYTKVYEKYFQLLRNEPITFLEVGFLNGASAYMWQDYFTRARLYFIDINPGCYEHARNLSNRCSLHIVDQTDTQALITFADMVSEFDIIIDDGGHTMAQQIITFKALFPYLKPGGLYIVEDLHTSYSPSYWQFTQEEKITTIEFLKKAIDDINYVGQKTFCADRDKCPAELKTVLSYYQEHIDSIHFHSSLCFIYKR